MPILGKPTRYREQSEEYNPEAKLNGTNNNPEWTEGEPKPAKRHD